jgi:tRNA-dihydrouridine synthase
MQTLLEEEPAAISLHGRTLKQKYNGGADWDAIARAVQVAKHSATLILGNGDLKDMRDVYRRVRETGVDGVLLGRSTQGNPWIFRTKGEVKKALRRPGIRIDPAPIPLEERFKVMLEHAAHFEHHWGAQSFVAMRKHLAWYCHSSPRAAELRAQMVRVSSVAEVVKSLSAYAASIDPRFEATNTPWREQHSGNSFAVLG